MIGPPESCHRTVYRTVTRTAALPGYSDKRFERWHKETSKSRPGSTFSSSGPTLSRVLLVPMLPG
eukprot:768781-Hanusia_phi.AAC.22